MSTAAPVPVAAATTGVSLKVVVSVVVVAALVGVGAGYAIFAGPGGLAREKITIAILPTATASEIQPRAVELEQFLEHETGYDIEILIPTTYSAVVEAIRFGHADAAFMSAASGTPTPRS